MKIFDTCSNFHEIFDRSSKCCFTALAISSHFRGSSPGICICIYICIFINFAKFCQIYFSVLRNLFVTFAKLIDFSVLLNVFVSFAKCISQFYKMYFSVLQNVFLLSRPSAPSPPPFPPLSSLTCQVRKLYHHHCRITIGSS